MASEWVYAFASVIGNGHLRDNIPCQDACAVVQHANFLIAVISDGAGTASNSDEGSRIVVTEAQSKFCALVINKGWHLGNAELPTENTWQLNAEETLSRIREHLENHSINQEKDIKSFACTIIVVIALEKGLLITHIGDGRAGYQTNTGSWKAMMIPYHGEYANETMFITSEWKTNKLWDICESKVVTEEIGAFCLLSDGCENAAFECSQLDLDKKIYQDKNVPYDPFFKPNIEALTNLHGNNMDQTKINELWSNFLEAGNETLRNELDDKTLVLCIRLH